MKLNEITDNPGARQDRLRVGRGIGSGVGKTGGRGQKGQKSRSGVSIKGFEGGQMPLHMRLPKRGFNKPNRAEYSEVNIGALQKAVDAGRLDAGQPVDMAALQAAGLVTQPRDGVRLLGKGAITAKLDLHVTGVTPSARAAVEAAGGSVSVPQPKVAAEG
ncbi:MAG: 50S ribosomal protein L15 [Sandaracinobacteroides sp.]